MPQKIKTKESPITTVPITTGTITLGAFLKLAGVADTGGMAGMMIAEGGVKVDGETCTQRGRKLVQGAKVRVNGKDYHVG